MLAITAIDLDRFAFALRDVAVQPIRWIAAVRENRASRKTYRLMLQMSDHQLRDIGLTRDDLRNALSQPPIWDDV